MRHLAILQNAVPLGFALLLSLLAANYYFTNRALQQMQIDQLRIAEVQGVRLEAFALFKTYLDAETGQRGYLLTGDERYLEPYNSAKAALDKGFRIKSVAAPQADLQAMRERLRPYENAKLAELKRTIELSKTQGLEAAVAVVKKGEGKAIMDAMRGVLNEIDETNRQETVRTLEYSRIQRRNTSAFFTASTLILGLSLIGLFVLTQRNLQEREQLLRIAHEAKDALQKSLATERAALSTATHANKLKDEFIAVVSHELRTPLNAIVGWTSLLREGVKDETELKEGLDTIDRNARAQTHLVDDLLDISRILTGKVRLNIEEVNLRAIAVFVIDGLRPAANARGVKVTLSSTAEAMEVLGDSDRLQQVIWNLLSNAIKFTARGGSVQVLLQNLESRVALEVSDSGQGIPSEFLARIFDRFSQADTSTTRGQAGLGLGLAITRHLVELHGGKISVRSAGVGHGSTFQIEIPIVAVREFKQQLTQREDILSAVTILPPGLSAHALEGLRVLALDDQQDTLEVVSRVLSRAGANVRVATNVDEALNILSAWKADVVVSDIGMPNQDGYTFVRELRDHPNADVRQVSTIALTAFAREQDRKEALDAGFNDHLAKPVDAAMLLYKVAHIAGRA